MSVVQVSQLRVDYDEVTAVDGISFTLERGKIFGFVGPNGAGKTSTIKAIAGILEATEGQVVLKENDLETAREKALAHIGYMPDFPPVYENLKVWEYLDVFAAAYGLRYEDRAKHIEKWLMKVDLTSKRDALIKGLSRGMRQRLVLAKTLAFGAEVLLLDEPASGLDPIARKQMRDLLREASANGVTILISSHILSELSGFVDSVIILEQGKIVLAGSIDEIAKQGGGKQKLMCKFKDAEHGMRVCEELISVWNLSSDQVCRKQDMITIHFYQSDQEATHFLHQLLSRDVILTQCAIKHDDIEDIFLKIGAKEVA